MGISTLFDRMAKLKATSLYLSVPNPPIFRIDGVLRAEGDVSLTPEEAWRLLTPLLPADSDASALQGGDSVPVRLERQGFVVEGQIFEYNETLAGVFHKV